MDIINKDYVRRFEHPCLECEAVLTPGEELMEHYRETGHVRYDTVRKADDAGP